MINSFLGTRLSLLAQEIGRVETVADIGTDHGKLPIFLLKNGITSKVYAVDVSDGSLKKAELLAEKEGLSDRIEFICGDGLRALPIIPEAVVIAGIGGNEIVKILRERPMQTEFFLIPHQDTDVVREYLSENGFNIIKDYVIRDRKYYEILVAVPGKCVYSAEELILGKNTPPSEYFLPRVKYRYDRINKILKEQNVTEDKLTEKLRKEYGALKKCLN